jgi:hypothetical protein
METLRLLHRCCLIETALDRGRAFSDFSPYFESIENSMIFSRGTTDTNIIIDENHRFKQTYNLRKTAKFAVASA